MALFYAVGKWNNYYDAMIYTSSNHLESLQLVLRRILIQNESALDNKVMLKDEILADAARRAELAYVMKYAMVFIGSLPLLVAYPFVQKYFVL